MNGRPRNRDVYLSKVEGMVYGDSRSDGFIRGQTFLHPELKLAFKVPDGFHLQNSPEAVVATAKDGSGIQFDGGKAPAGRDAKTYLTSDFANEIKLRPRNVETFDVNGMHAATGTATAQTNSGNVDVRMVAIQYEPGTMYRFLLITPTNVTKSRDAAMRARDHELPQALQQRGRGAQAAAHPHRESGRGRQRGFSCEPHVLQGLPRGALPRAQRTWNGRIGGLRRALQDHHRVTQPVMAEQTRAMSQEVSTVCGDCLLQECNL